MQERSNRREQKPCTKERNLIRIRVLVSTTFRPPLISSLFHAPFAHRYLAGTCPSGASWYVPFFLAATLASAGARRSSIESLTLGQVGKFQRLPSGKFELVVGCTHVKIHDKKEVFEMPFCTTCSGESHFAADIPVDFIYLFAQTIKERFGVSLHEWFADSASAKARRAQFTRKKVVTHNYGTLAQKLQGLAVAAGEYRATDRASVLTHTHQRPPLSSPLLTLCSFAGYPPEKDWPFQRCFRRGMVSSMLKSAEEETHQDMLAVGKWSMRASENLSTPNSVYEGSQAAAQRVYHNAVGAMSTGLPVREQHVFTGTPLEQLFSRIRNVHTEELKLVDPRKHKPNAQNYDLLRTMFKAACVTARVKKKDTLVSQMQRSALRFFVHKSCVRMLLTHTTPRR